MSKRTDMVARAVDAERSGKIGLAAELRKKIAIWDAAGWDGIDDVDRIDAHDAVELARQEMIAHRLGASGVPTAVPTQTKAAHVDASGDGCRPDAAREAMIAARRRMAHEP